MGFHENEVSESTDEGDFFPWKTLLNHARCLVGERHSTGKDFLGVEGVKPVLDGFHVNVIWISNFS